MGDVDFEAGNSRRDHPVPADGPDDRDAAGLPPGGAADGRTGEGRRAVPGGLSVGEVVDTPARDRVVVGQIYREIGELKANQSGHWFFTPATLMHQGAVGYLRAGAHHSGTGTEVHARAA